MEMEKTQHVTIVLMDMAAYANGGVALLQLVALEYRPDHYQFEWRNW